MNPTPTAAPAHETARPPGEPSPGSGVPLLLAFGMVATLLLGGGALYVASRKHEARREMAMRAEMEAMMAVRGAERAGDGPTAQGRLPLMGDFPDFSLTDHTGKPFGNADLSGRVWVLQFFFACCDKSCPTMVRQMADLQRRIMAPDVRFVSVSVDPDRDTPAGVASHAARFAEVAGLADRSRWSLLTGDRPRIVKLLEDCKLPLSPTALIDKGDLGHVDKFFLVDAKARLRGMYNYDEPTRMQALEADIATLVAEAQAAPGSSATGPGSTSASGSR